MFTHFSLCSPSLSENSPYDLQLTVLDQLTQDVLGVLEALGDALRLGSHGGQWDRLALAGAVSFRVRHDLGLAAQDHLGLVVEAHLDRAVAQPEDHGLLRDEPALHVDHIADHVGVGQQDRLVLGARGARDDGHGPTTATAQVALEVLDQGHLLVQRIGEGVHVEAGAAVLGVDHTIHILLDTGVVLDAAGDGLPHHLGGVVVVHTGVARVHAVAHTVLVAEVGVVGHPGGGPRQGTLLGVALDGGVGQQGLVELLVDILEVVQLLLLKLGGRGGLLLGSGGGATLLAVAALGAVGV
eukprot:252272_1